MYCSQPKLAYQDMNKSFKTQPGETTLLMTQASKRKKEQDMARDQANPLLLVGRQIFKPTQTYSTQDYTYTDKHT